MKRIAFLAVAAALVPCSISTPMAHGFSGGLDSKPADHLAAMRAAGLRGNRSQLSALRNTVKNPNSGIGNDFLLPADQLNILTALHALAELGDTEALPDINQLIAKTSRNLTVMNFAKVERARLLVESDLPGTAGSQAQMAAKVSDFFAASALSPGDLNAGAKHYQHQLLTEPQGAGNGTPCPVEVYAMREIADMAYQSHAQEFASLPGVSQIDFSLDYPSALKIRLAPLSKEARINVLIDSLVNAQFLRGDQDYNMQLLADEGSAATYAIADRLGEIRKHRDQYREINISVLFRVLGMIGDPKQSSAVAQFQSDPDINVRQEAEFTGHNLQTGLASVRPRAAGY